MSLLDGLRHRLHVLLHPRDYGRELAEQAQFHLELEAMQQAHAARGTASAADARAAARRRFGNVTTYHEDTRRMAGLGFFDVAGQDLRFALRSFRRTPGFTLVAVLTLAIGIGANTAIFSAVNAMLLRPLPFPRPEQLMQLSLTRPPRGDTPARDDAPWSYPKYVVFRDAQRIFAHEALWTDNQFTLRGGDDTERARGEIAGAGYLPALGVRPLVGRNFLPEEDRQRGDVRVVMLGHDLWQRRFNGDRGVIGRPLNVDGDPYTIVGVLPAGFRGLSGRAELWVPVTSLPAGDLAEPWSHSFSLVARLKDGVDVRRAKDVVRQLGRRVDDAYPDPEMVAERHGAMARELDATRVDPLVRRSLVVLFGAVGLVLLIACANVANLFLVRAAGRQREIAVRLAVGAGRGRLVRQLLTESVLLSALGGVASVFVAWWGVRLLSALDPGDALRLQGLGGLGAVNFSTIRLDLPALAFTAALAMATGILFGLVPALQATRPSLSHGLKDGADRPRTGGARGVNSRTVLAVAEMALALVLLAGSGLMLRSLGNLLAVRPGFDAAQLLTMRIQPQVIAPPVGAGSVTNTAATARPLTRDSLPGFYEHLSERLAALPGVTSVGISDCPPVSGGCNGTVIAFRDRAPAAPGTEPQVGVHWANAAWFTTMRVPLVRGRLFSSADRPGVRKAVIVNETAARRFWPGQDPIGRPVSVGQGGFWNDTALVVGVVGDVRYERIDSAAGPEVYLPYSQSAFGRAMLFIRTTGDPLALTGAARGVLREVAPEMVVFDVRSMEARLAVAMAYARFSTVLLVIFGVVAMALATMGTYGVIAFAASQRRREMGIRIALGAARADVVRLVVRQGAGIAVAGAVIGVAIALASTRVLRAYLYGVAPNDPFVFAAMVALLAGAVLLASWIPARRAASVAPTEAIRAD